jgi:hypothetical protein
MTCDPGGKSECWSCSGQICTVSSHCQLPLSFEYGR